MSLLDSLGLGGLMGQNQIQSNQGGFQRAQQYNNSQLGAQMNQSYLHQQLYKQAIMMKNRPRWIFDGVECNGPREMADIIWANDCPEKTHFLLKYE